jgi:prevent-host-death family protein
MDIVPELIPISDIRQRQNEILARLIEGPVVLTQHGRGAAVLVSPDLWNSMVMQLEDLQDALDALESRQDAGTVDFDDYLTRRGEHVPAIAEA